MPDSALTVRPITDDEVEAFTVALAAGFNSHPREGEADIRRSGMILDRTLGAFVDGTLVGTARSFPTPLTLPGGATVTAAAVTNVAVVPTHRRRGILTAMMRAQLDDAAARGEPIAILVAAEAPIYGRYGYGPAANHCTLKIDTSLARFAVRPAAADALRIVTNDELRAVGPAIYDRYRLAQPGSIGRDDRWWNFWTGVMRRPGDDDVDKRFHVVCGDDGSASYTIEDDWHGRLPANKVELNDIVAATPEAYAALWWHVVTLDWVRKIEVADRPLVEPLPLLLGDSRHAVLADASDFLWARLLDLPAVLAARRYDSAGAIVLEVVDVFTPAWGGRFVLSVDESGAATCEATAAAADLTVTAADVAAASLGGTALWPAAWIGRVDEHTAGAVRRFDALFTSQPPPFCNTWF